MCTFAAAQCAAVVHAVAMLTDYEARKNCHGWGMSCRRIASTAHAIWTEESIICKIDKIV